LRGGSDHLKRFSFPDQLKFLKSMKFSQRRFLFVAMGIATVILIVVFVIIPLFEKKREVEEEIIQKKSNLLKYERFLQTRKTIEEEHDRTVKQYEEAQQKLLSGDSPQLGAANLQEIVKRLSEKNGIGIRSFRMLEPKEMNIYLRIPLHIDLNPVNSMLSLGQFMYDIEHHEKELMISEMDFLVFNPRMPNSIQGSLVISGLMNKTKTKEKGRQG
jgi:Tfp pilus assembly protein PilO